MKFSKIINEMILDFKTFNMKKKIFVKNSLLLGLKHDLEDI